MDFFALRPDQVTHSMAFWQLGTYLFLHNPKPPFFHILFNMFTLWMFGGEVEHVLGSKKFLRFYLMCGVGAGMFYILFNWNSPIPVIGASGAIFGVLVAFAVFFPERIITLLLFFVLPVHLKAKHLVAIFIAITFFSSIQGQLSGVTSGVAYLAHLGGALVGYLLLRGDSVFAKFLREIRFRQEKKKIMQKQREQDNVRQKRAEIDRILDRINEVGYDKISDKEKEFLKKASEFLSREE
ncbi:MAG: rhomboid family intramembrane serine protease [Actinobacteria bacterium]|nr:rhomboid family intramembrane serine protease [Actinomycetota bacterium]